MTDRSIESVSALMDGEVTDFELRRTLARIESEPELAETWQRYHLIRSAIRSEDGNGIAVDISSSVMSALESEPEFHLEDGSTDSEKAVSKSHFLNRPSYSLPTGTLSNDIVRAQFGNRSNIEVESQQPEIIRLPQGIDRYIEQHEHMLKKQKPNWQASWLPDGFSGLRSDVMPHAEVQIFSNGRNTFSVCVENYGHQSVSEGVAQSGNMVAVGKRIGDQFVTVVGDVPLMIAERIASSVVKK